MNENLFYEMDNLNALFMLRETHLNKIKCIYIDPPYNTGNKQSYNDKRTHNEWKSFMYPRLYLARDLLREDGVIFISIDDNEQHHLRMICDEIFGEGNFVEMFIIKSNPRGNQASKLTAKQHDFVLCYAKHKDIILPLSMQLDETQKKEFNKIDNLGYYRELGLRKRGADSRREDSPNLFYPIFFNPITLDLSLDSLDGYMQVLPMLENGDCGRWRWSKAKFQTEKDVLYARKVNVAKNNERYDVFQKDYLANRTRKSVSMLYDKKFNYENGTLEVKRLFGHKVFSYPKPISLVQYLINIASTQTNSNDLILDFFAGSCTTAHAVMKLNAEDGGNRKWIMVQLPEPCDEKSEAFKAGYKTIADIGKERIRRAAKQLGAGCDFKVILTKNI